MSVRAVFLVHGVGEHKRGQFLEAVLEPLMRFLRTSFADPHVTVHQRPANGPAHATIEFLNERWEVWEVWWTQAFHAQTGQRVLLWAYRALALKALRFLAGTLPFYRTRRTPPTTHPVYQGPPITYGGVVYDIVVGLSLTMILVLAYIPLLLLASVLYVLSLLPAWLFFPRLLRVAVVKLASYVVQGPGDQYALMFTETAAAAAQQPFRDVLGLYFDPSRTDRRHCDSATVIAHSAGATLAFATLSDPVLWRTWTGTSEPPVDMTLFTVGSSLTVSDDNVPNHPMWQTSLPQRITWVDLWARYDPVPQGPPRRQLAQRVRGPAGHFFTVRVVNVDSPFSDHTEYWANHEEVVSRFIYEIAGRPSAGPPGRPTTTPSEQIRAAVDRALQMIHSHRKRIGTISLIRLLVIAFLAIVLGVFRGWFVYLGGLVQRGLSADMEWPQAVQGVAGLLRIIHQHAPEFIVGVVVFVLGIFVLWQLVRLWFGGLMYPDPWA